MDAKKFREFGHAAVEFVAEYLETVHERQVLPSVQPGYLYELLPSEVPEKPEDWRTVMKDINEKILPGITNWQSPNFHAYFPEDTSYPSIVGDLITSGLGVNAFTWIASPASTELEVIVVNSLGKMLDLPEEFLNCSEGPGGGVIQGTASESILVAMITAREQAAKRLQIEYANLSESEIRGRMVMYSSFESNAAIEKSALMAAVPVRLIHGDEKLSLRGKILADTIDEDVNNGLFPIACIATLGTTTACAFDALKEIGPICQQNGIWLHVDAAYAGSALCCPEFRPLMQGIEYADSLNINLYKLMMVSFECCAMWFKDATQVVDAVSIDRTYLKYDQKDVSTVPDYRHWSLFLGRRFRALKVWITLRTLGAETIRRRVRKHVQLAKHFKSKVLSDKRFEIAFEPAMGLVCFRLKGDCELTKKLLEKITNRRNIFMCASECYDKLIIRFVVCSPNTELHDIDFAWQEIQSQADSVLRHTDNINSISLPLITS